MRESFRQDFDGHIAPELGVVRLIDFSHPACANLRDDFVGAEISCRWRASFLQPSGPVENYYERALKGGIRLENQKALAIGRNSVVVSARPPVV